MKKTISMRRDGEIELERLLGETSIGRVSRAIYNREYENRAQEVESDYFGGTQNSTSQSTRERDG